jgi:hypothetical protein
MAGLVPAIHAVIFAPHLQRMRCGAAWMTGSSPVMTIKDGHDDQVRS